MNDDTAGNWLIFITCYSAIGRSMSFRRETTRSRYHGAPCHSVRAIDQPSPLKFSPQECFRPYVTPILPWSSALRRKMDVNHLGMEVGLGAKTCVDGIVRREAGLPITPANHHILNVSINPQSGS